MSLAEYQNTLAWQGAIDLGIHVLQLAEQLPQSEQAGLAMQLQHLSIDLPGTIADDLLEGTSTRKRVALRLVVALELIERIYPALDPGPAKEKLDQLLIRLDSESFSEQVTAVAPVSSGQVPLQPEPTVQVSSESEQVPEVAAVLEPVSAPAETVLLVNEPIPEAGQVETPPAIVHQIAVNTEETQSVHVQPSSVQ